MARPPTIRDFYSPLSQHNRRTPRFFTIRVSDLDPHKTLVGTNPVDLPRQPLAAPAPVINPTEIGAKCNARDRRGFHGDQAILNAYVVEFRALGRIEPAFVQRFQDRRHG